MNLPTAADNTFQGKTSTINFAFTGTQRAAHQQVGAPRKTRITAPRKTRVARRTRRATRHR